MIRLINAAVSTAACLARMSIATSVPAFVLSGGSWRFALLSLTLPALMTLVTLTSALKKKWSRRTLRSISEMIRAFGKSAFQAAIDEKQAKADEAIEESNSVSHRMDIFNWHVLDCVKFTIRWWIGWFKSPSDETRETNVEEKEDNQNEAG